MSTGNAKVRLTLPEISIFPTAVFLDLRLSLDTRAVLGWALSRPNDWNFRIGHMCHTLGITDKKWPRMRDELVAVGYLSVSQKRGPVFSKKTNKIIENAIVWEYEFTDAPLLDSLLSSIPPNRGDGENSQNLDSIPPKRMDGSGMDGKRGGYQEHSPIEFNNYSPAPPARDTHEPEAQGSKPPPAGECVELFQNHEKWPELLRRVKKSSTNYFRIQLAKLTLKGGGSVTERDVDAITTYLIQDGHDVIGALRGILKRGGWDPVRLCDAARPGESSAEAKNRLSGVGAQEHDPASDAAPPPQKQENHEQDINYITSTLKNNIRLYPQHPHLVEPEFELLKEHWPKHPFVQEFENHKKAAAAGDYKTHNK